MARFATLHFPLLKKHGWHFPPTIGEKLVKTTLRLIPNISAIPESLDRVLGSAELLGEMVKLHPEGTLCALYAERLAAQYNMQMGAANESDLAAARDALIAFEQSIETPGWVRSVKQTSQIGILGTSLALFHRHQDEVEKNHKRFIKASSAIHPASVANLSNLRAIAVGLITIKAYDQAVRWCDRWLEVAGDRNLDAVWHRVVLDRWRERWLDVLKQCNIAIETFPEHEPLQGLRNRAIIELQSEIDSKSSN